MNILFQIFGGLLWLYIFSKVIVYVGIKYIYYTPISNDCIRKLHNDIQNFHINPNGIQICKIYLKILWLAKNSQLYLIFWNIGIIEKYGTIFHIPLYGPYHIHINYGLNLLIELNNFNKIKINTLWFLYLGSNNNEVLMFIKNISKLNVTKTTHRILNYYIDIEKDVILYAKTSYNAIINNKLPITEYIKLEN